MIFSKHRFDIFIFSLSKDFFDPETEKKFLFYQNFMPYHASAFISFKKNKILLGYRQKLLVNDDIIFLLFIEFEEEKL